MSTFGSEAALRRWAWTTLAALALATLAFYWVQNRLGVIGGAIAFSKAAWLALAIFSWILLPMLLLADRRLAPVLKAPFAWLLALMVARAVAEGLMLYVLHNWSPWYGMGHDAICVAVLWGLALRGLRAGAHRGPDPAPRVVLHAAVTGLTFFPEVYYAWYMQANFNTRGGSATYFVPDDGLHAVVLAVTACVDVVLTCYLFWFLKGWLHGKATRARP